MYMDSIMAP